ncbi:hypothetical protein K470DRAFT_294804 [Piedraia hortae CBS 480.64]|uniref:DUF3818 domain-containing protein n=1 Tax=Piedraia hortae CBS 480.64 TaxID=1314780 RepID=A0A6A7BZB0_9PEZI|nr:hypothetical protein K470DRAFT_294804 [Piedraia hortae CBS 480.64]
MDGAGRLTEVQTHALFDVLIHRQTYDEIEQFKQPDAIRKYGPPFQDNVKSSQTPMLQALLAKFVLPLPGLSSIRSEFWRIRVKDLIEELSQAELSESYDKGMLGIRKTLATAISSLLESPARASLGGMPQHLPNKYKNYDLQNPEDVMQSWNDALQLVVYDDLIDETLARTAATGDLSQHSSLIQAVHEFIVVNLASLMHYALVLSPEGPALVKLIQTVHTYVPYTAIRQPLKIGNVATMISALMRVILAKASVASVTNWMGLTSGAPEGMNLLQQVLTQVLNWDKRDLKKRSEKIETEIPKVCEEIRKWISRPREEHAECRRQSEAQNMSMVSTILSISNHPTDLNETQHTKASEYLRLQLSIRDRQEISKIICRRHPDHLTLAVRDLVDAYTPMIRHVHRAVNLSDTVWDFEQFLTDMLKTSQAAPSPSVEDYVGLLHRHQSSCHKFLHQAARNGEEMVNWWRAWAHNAAAHFKQGRMPPASPSLLSDKNVSGGILTALRDAFAALPPEEQASVTSELDAYATYMEKIQSASAERIASIISKNQSEDCGPGAYLARWQHLLDMTRLTPKEGKGPVRGGRSENFPSMVTTLRVLGPAFGKALAR